MITVCNKSNMPKVEFGSVVMYIGRGTSLGNNYYIGNDGNRHTVIKKYRKWLWNELKAEESPAGLLFEHLLDQAKLGKNLYLVCHCAPKPCHADIIKRALEWKLNK